MIAFYSGVGFGVFASLGGHMRQQFTAAFGLLLLALATETAAASCMPGVRWVNGQTVDGYMTVRSGKACHLNFRSRGPTDRTAIVARPSHGTASVNANGRVTYRANAGYVGSDTFTYARQGMDSQNNKMDARIRVDVKVTP